MNLRGERFISHKEFIRYCKDLNVHTYESELEHFEKIGEMLPVARVIFPIEYVIDHELWAYCSDPTYNNVRYMDVEAQDELRRLLQEINRSPSSADFSDDELIHGFDREFDKKNQFLSRPNTDAFQVWAEYKVCGFSLISQSPLDKPVTPSLISACHYYSYWQVHQLYSVQQYLRKNGAAPQYLAIDAKMRSNFDALSFWITMYRLERQRAFANVPDKYGVKRLDDSRYANYRKRLRNHADTVVDRFGLGRDGLYRFLHSLVERYESYRKNERYKLADALRQDIFDLQRLIEIRLCDDFDRISDELRRISIGEEWSVRGFKYRDVATTFRHLDIATKERDYACDLIADISDRCCADLEKLGCQDWAFTSADAKGLLAYCEQEGLGLLLTALGGMSSVGEEERRHNFRSVQRYTNLKNALTSYEYLLKSLGEKANLDVGGKTLRPAICATMGKQPNKQPWFDLYKKKVKSGLTSAKCEEEFFRNLEKLHEDRELQQNKVVGYWARMFLITHLARNAAVHLYPKGDRYFADPFGTTLHAVVNAACYTWKLAQSENWQSSESSDEPK